LVVVDGGVPVVPTLGSFNVSTQFTVPVQAQGISTSGSSGPTAADIAAALLAALQATTIPVDTRRMNGADVVGNGSEADPWRGAGVSP